MDAHGAAAAKARQPQLALCPECKAIGDTNLAAGHPELAEAVRNYCLSGHNEEHALPIEE